ncbi:hypothetical protein [Psychromicrobium xiongbiense]|uniref:hypothetical protein n=1 Tax=Psychromicrobium xiongbiense TaxID=3051184 RepID=UPI002553F2AA|nr:hypothetical protein [Psychromicrobium sp. YIM S02556]
MTRKVDLPASLAMASFTLAEARAAGVSRGRLSARDLRSPSQGIFIPVGADQSLAQRLRPYAALSPQLVFSHVTAARLHGFPLPRALEEEGLVHLSGPGHPMRRRHVRRHRSAVSAEEVVMVDAVPVTSLARTWCDLASLVRPASGAPSGGAWSGGDWSGLRAGFTADDLVACADWLISENRRGFRERTARLSAEELRSYVAGRTRVRGLSAARAAVAAMRPGVDSPRETRLRLMLARAGFSGFVPNVPIEGEPGELPVWVDLGWREARICCEYEGGHHATPDQQISDRRRDALVAERGWTMVKVYARDMALGPDWVSGLVRQVLPMLESGAPEKFSPDSLKSR